MPYLNQCQFLGNIGQDLKVTSFEKSGDKIGRTSMALTKRWTKHDTGEKGSKTTWVNIVFPSHLVENAAKFITKGKQVLVTAEVENREYEKDGQKHTITEYRVSNYQLLGSPKGEGGDNGGDNGGDDGPDEDPYAGM